MLVNQFGNKIPATGGFGPEVSLLLHCDGVDTGTSFPDASSYAHTVTANGTANTDTAIKKFGSAALEFGATAGYLSVPDDTTLQFGTGDFSIDYWIYWSSTGGTFLIISKGSVSDIYQPYFSGGQAWLFVNGSGVYGPLGGATLINDTWTHYEISRTSGVIYTFIGGVIRDSRAHTAAWNGGTGALFIGKDQGVTYSTGHHIDEFRMQKGTFGHTSNFTPPSGPYS